MSAGPRRSGLAIFVALALAACTPETQMRSAPFAAPMLAGDALHMGDGTILPFRMWQPRGKPRAVIVGVHGMNDYSNAFALPAAAWRERGIATYAYDQRGFGGAAGRGIWAGTDTMAADFATAVRLIRARHPGVPVYAVGSSMGGGVILAAMASAEPPPVDGVVLAAPAVWGRAAMPPYYTAALWLAAHTVPQARFTGQGLRRVASDNGDMLRAQARDPLVIKGARVDTIYGVVGLMDSAYAAAPRLAVPALLLYGANDQIIPKEPVAAVARALPPDKLRTAYYARGWHMLLRDRQAAVVHADVAAWIFDRAAPLPSGADRPDALGQLTGR